VLVPCWVLAGVGCNTLRFLTLTVERKDTRPEKESTTGPAPARPSRCELRIPPIVFHSDFELKREQPIFQELTQLRDQVYKELQLPTSNATVDVYLFEDKARYERYMRDKYPELPPRRAFFVAQPRSVGHGEELLVFTSWDEKKIQQDLRHELTHAVLHSVLKDVPLWLDEGLAEYFELPTDQQGVNLAHVEQLRRAFSSGGRPSIARLENLSQVKDMTPAEYREAWAWVHLMLRGSPEAKRVLLDFVQQLRTNPSPGPLQPRLTAVVANLNDLLEAHLARLESSASTNRTQR
jgi:hypothetical protein